MRSRMNRVVCTAAALLLAGVGTVTARQTQGVPAASAPPPEPTARPPLVRVLYEVARARTDDEAAKLLAQAHTLLSQGTDVRAVDADGRNGLHWLSIASSDARRTGTAPLPMTRTRPDGVELAWRLTGTETAFAEGVPFFIQWQVDGADHPGRAPAQHRVAATGIDWVELGGDPQRLASWLGSHDLPLRHVEGAPGPRRVAIAVAGGEPIVIGEPAPG